MNILCLGDSITEGSVMQDKIQASARTFAGRHAAALIVALMGAACTGMVNKTSRADFGA